MNNERNSVSHANAIAGTQRQMYARMRLFAVSSATLLLSLLLLGAGRLVGP